MKPSVPSRAPRMRSNLMSAAAQALAVSATILGLFTYWFGVGDRYAVFLYNHLGATAFDSVTVGRYAMTGLVACGIVLVVYTLVHGVAGVIMSRLVGTTYHVPPFRLVWLLCAPLVGPGIVWITMSVNHPVLPLPQAMLCAGVTLIGLPLALMAAEPAAQRPAALLWVSLSGIGLVPPLLLLRALELVGSGGVLSPTAAGIFAVGSVVAGALWLAAINWLRTVASHPSPGALPIFFAGLAWSYLILPLIHYLFATPPDFRYITAASNFFAQSPLLQGFTWLVAWMLVYTLTGERRRTAAGHAT